MAPAGTSRRRHVAVSFEPGPNIDLSLTTPFPVEPTLCANDFDTSAIVLNVKSKYPNRRAYVLKLRADATPSALAGRIENFVTGQQIEFASAHELLQSIARELEPAAGNRPAHADGSGVLGATARCCGSSIPWPCTAPAPPRLR